MTAPAAGRVIAGSARGRRLLAPGSATRPLTDRVKQTLFAVLEPVLRGARVLDLFAGSGAGGIEALSRGAACALFVDQDRGAVEVIAENLRRTGLAGPSVVVVRSAVEPWLMSTTVGAVGGGFDIVLVDPPYADTDTLGRTLDRLGDPAAGWLAPGATVVAKHFWRNPPGERVGLLRSTGVRRFGETALTFLTVFDDVPGPSPVADGTEAE